MDGLIHVLYHGSNPETPLMCFINDMIVLVSNTLEALKERHSSNPNDDLKSTCQFFA